MARCNTQAKDKATTTKHRKTPGATVSGCYNTPPLREDLVPRSRMAPEGKNGREREEVKLSCFFDKRVKPRTLKRLSHFEKKNTTEMNEVENTPLEKRNKEEQIRAALRLKREAKLDRWEELEEMIEHSG